MTKRTVKVYRLEDDQGNGIFRTNRPGTHFRYVHFLDENFGKHEHPDVWRHQMPYKDSAIQDAMTLKCKNPEWYWGHTQGNLLFGFKTLKQFRFWFYKKEWRLKLTMMGIKLNLYEVPAEEVIKGKTQVVFDRTKAQLVKSLTPMYRDLSIPKRNGNLLSI